MPGLKFPHETAAFLAQGFFVKDVDRRPKFIGKVQGVAASHNQVALAIYRGSLGQNDLRDHDIDSPNWDFGTPWAVAVTWLKGNQRNHRPDGDTGATADFVDWVVAPVYTRSHQLGGTPVLDVSTPYRNPGYNPVIWRGLQ